MIDLGRAPNVSPSRRAALDNLIRTLSADPPAHIAHVVLDELAVDLTTRYAGQVIPHPFGKASGQLSCRIHQLEEDADSGLAFVVLKTVIAEDARGDRSMARWSNPETRMVVEPRTAPYGRRGWTVTWKGRGWAGSLSEYLDFLDNALQLTKEKALLVVPSVKFHLPAEVGAEPLQEEYDYTTRALQRVWAGARSDAIILEKDLSPTLAGDSLADSQSVIDFWLSNLTGWIKGSVPQARVGIKLMNAMFDEAFQVRMIRTLAASPVRPDFLVVFNRLFDRPTGVAYGGWDLSDRNFAVLDQTPSDYSKDFALSATGNICSGRVMLEYAIRGCENGQIHTFLQVPRSEYLINEGSRARCALFTLLLHPETGLVPWLWTLNEMGMLEERGGTLYFADAVGCGLS